VGDWSRELAGFGKTGAEETWDLLDQGIRGDKGVVLAREFLDQLLVLVELFEIVRGHGIDAVVLGSVNIMLITKDTIEGSVCVGYRVVN